jgi:leader peptidase (prepilin peptidase)/N-methyltransferase
VRLVLGLALAAVLVPVTVSDLERRVIPNAVVGPGALLAVGVITVLGPGALPEHLLAGAAAGGFFLVAALARPQGMGMGDVKLAGMLGLYLGRAVAPAVVVALLAGVLVGAAVVARGGGRPSASVTVPFGPFLALGAAVGLLAGDRLLDGYLGASG